MLTEQASEGNYGRDSARHAAIPGVKTVQLFDIRLR